MPNLLYISGWKFHASNRSMNDEDGPQIADTFYEHLFRGCDLGANPPALPDLTKAAEALHFAVKKLRKESGMTFKRWVPFVHYGL